MDHAEQYDRRQAQAGKPVSAALGQTYAITIGAYRLTDFVHLNIHRCRRLFGEDVPIIISDDKSDRSQAMADLAEEHGCDYTVGASRRSHFSGDLQAFIVAIQFAEEIGADVAIKISQRFIPVLSAFKKALDDALTDKIAVALPGRINPQHIARPQARFYSKFGILTDVVALRRGAITPTELIDAYRDRCGPGRRASDSFAETTWGWLISNRFPNRHRLMPEWTNHVPFEPKIYLRKSQSTEHEYAQVAAMEGIKGTWDLREWGKIEGRQYRAKADVV